MDVLFFIKLAMQGGWMASKLGMFPFQRIYELLNDTTEWEIYTQATHGSHLHIHGGLPQKLGKEKQQTAVILQTKWTSDRFAKNTQ